MKFAEVTQLSHTLTASRLTNYLCGHELINLLVPYVEQVETVELGRLPGNAAGSP